MQELSFLLYKVQCLIGILDTAMTHNLTYEIVYNYVTGENYHQKHKQSSIIASGYFILLERL